MWSVLLDTSIPATILVELLDGRWLRDVRCAQPCGTWSSHTQLYGLEGSWAGRPGWFTTAAARRPWSLPDSIQLSLYSSTRVDGLQRPRERSVYQARALRGRSASQRLSIETHRVTETSDPSCSGTSFSTTPQERRLLLYQGDFVSSRTITQGRGRVCSQRVCRRRFDYGSRPAQ